MNRLSISLTVLALAAFSLTSCRQIQGAMGNPQPRGNAADPRAVVPADFLFTRYAPLNHWLDTPVRVQILDEPLLDVFQHPALRGLAYDIVKMPSANPRITIDKLALTRRQLLWVLSQDYQLHMTPAFGGDGVLRCIEIRSRGVDLPKALRD